MQLVDLINPVSLRCSRALLMYLLNITSRLGPTLGKSTPLEGLWFELILQAGDVSLIE
jgi:hypothetical protein